MDTKKSGSNQQTPATTPGCPAEEEGEGQGDGEKGIEPWTKYPGELIAKKGI